MLSRELMLPLKNNVANELSGERWPPESKPPGAKEVDTGNKPFKTPDILI